MRRRSIIQAKVVQLKVETLINWRLSRVTQRPTDQSSRRCCSPLHTSQSLSDEICTPLCPTHWQSSESWSQVAASLSPNNNLRLIWRNKLNCSIRPAIGQRATSVSVYLQISLLCSRLISSSDVALCKNVSFRHFLLISACFEKKFYPQFPDWIQFTPEIVNLI